jgi:hypothetical protein
MKKLFLILTVFIIPACYAQDNITMETGKVYKTKIQRITTDSVYFSYEGEDRGESILSIKEFESDDEFKEFLLSKKESKRKFSNYTNYCLSNYGSSANAGKFFMLVGSGATMASFIKLSSFCKEDSDATADDFKKAYGIGIVGGAVTLLGILIDMSANSWIKNLSAAPEYEIGIGYKFEF